MSQRSKLGFKPINGVIPIVEVTAYSGFTNQPANDDIEIISSSASDTQKITVLYIDNADNIQQITSTLQGLTPITIATTPKAKTLLGAYLGNVDGSNPVRAVGTITIREASGDLAITTIAAGKLGTGVQRFLIAGQDVSMDLVSGNIWLDVFDGIPSTTGAYFKLSADLDLNVSKYLTMISDTTATVQIALR